MTRLFDFLDGLSAQTVLAAAVATLIIVGIADIFITNTRTED